jgi:hypothetical protein
LCQNKAWQVNREGKNMAIFPFGKWEWGLALVENDWCMIITEILLLEDM